MPFLKFLFFRWELGNGTNGITWLDHSTSRLQRTIVSEKKTMEAVAGGVIKRYCSQTTPTRSFVTCFGCIIMAVQFKSVLLLISNCDMSSTHQSPSSSMTT